MIRRCLFAIFFLLSIFSSRGSSLPLTTKDVSLMLRGGDSNAVVMRELSARKFIGKVDPETENTLIQAGANSELIAALRSGAYSLPPEQATKAQLQIVDVNSRRAVQVEESRRMEPLQQQQNAQKKVAIQKAPNPNATSDYLKGCLVQIHNGSLAPADDDSMAKKKLIAYYFSAHWCAPCRKFTPQLIDYYNRVSVQHPEFEIVFVSADKSADAMESYMRQTQMPWPAIAYSKRDEKPEIAKAAGSGIPSLVLVESTGRLLSSAYDGSKYLGPQKVLDDLDGIFAGKTPAQIALAQD